MICIFRTEFFTCFYKIALKKNFPLRGKTKDAKLRLLFPHISDSINFDYLKGIFNGFSGSLVSVALIPKEIFLLAETTIYDHLVYYSASYYIIVATNS